MRHLVRFVFAFGMAVSIGKNMKASFFKIVKHNQRIIIERLGKYHKILEPGFRFIVPLVDRPRKATWSDYTSPTKQSVYPVRTVERIDMRETVYEYPPQGVITQDNVMMSINAILYCRIVDPVKALYGVTNLPEAIEKLTQTSLRNLIGSMTLDSTLNSRDIINEKLCAVLDKAAEKWGVEVTRIELQAVEPPKNILKAMEKEMEAERIKRAMVIEADGIRDAEIRKAEGKAKAVERMSQAEAFQRERLAEAEAFSRKQLAQADAFSRERLAEAESNAIKQVQDAIPGVNPLSYLLGRDYVNALPKVAEGKETKLMIVPSDEVPLIKLLASINQVGKSEQ